MHVRRGSQVPTGSTDPGDHNMRASRDAAIRPRIAPGPVTVTTMSEKDGTPIAGVYVHIGGRQAATGFDGRVIFDGVPAGTHKLFIEHYGYDRLAQDLILPAGKRDAIELSLTPVEMVLLTGTVVVEGHGGALAGARIALAPLAVPAACQGHYDFATTWDGTFQVIQIPPGKYSVRISATGCLTRTFEFSIVPTMSALRWELAREFQLASLEVSLTDSVTGEVVRGAQVTLAEAGTVGLIATAAADAKGKAVFKDLKVGTLNWGDEKGNLAISRRAVTVLAEADDYETGIINVTLAENATASLALNPTTKISGDGDNKTLATAMTIRTGAPVDFTIPQVGDKRFYRFRVDYISKIRITIGPDNLLETYMYLLDAQGTRLRETGAGIGQDNILDAGGLPIGDYYVQVEEWGNNNASSRPLTLTIIRTPAPDAFEPSDTTAAARLLRVGEEIRGCILPLRDVDWFRFEVQRPCHVRVTMAVHPNERYVFIRGVDGRPVKEAGAGAAQPLVLGVSLGPGAYLLDVHEWGENAEFHSPYTLRLEQIEDDGIDDPPYAAGKPCAVRDLRLGGLTASTIFPIGDNDTYTVFIPSAGRLHLQFISVTEFYAYIIAGDGRNLKEGGVNRGEMGHVTCDLVGPCTVFVRVHEWGDNECSPWPYIISTWFEPCDEMELAGRNDTAETATPIELNEPIRGSIMPVGDVDWYRLEADYRGWLRINASGTTELYAYLRNANQAVVGEGGAARNAPLVLERPVFPGTYYIEMHEWGNNDSSPVPYCLTAHIRRAEPTECIPTTGDMARVLNPGEGQAYWIDHVGNVERFVFTMARAGMFTIRIRSPLETYVYVYDDQTNIKVDERGTGAGGQWMVELEAKNPTRYRLEVHEWGDNDYSREPSFILVDIHGRYVPGEWVTAEADPYEPTKVTFTRKTLSYVEAGSKVAVDADGDGVIDTDLTSGTATFEYKSEGVYKAVAYVTSESGVRTKVPFWVEATGPRERKGVYIVADCPYEGQVVEHDLLVRARAISYSGLPITSMSLVIDGKKLGVSHSAPFEFDVPWAHLGPVLHKLSLTAVDAGGEFKTLDRTCSVSQYFDLQPTDGAVVSGNRVLVTWHGTFGQALVRYRVQGEVDWKEAVGENAGARTVAIEDLEPGKAYEFQPVGGEESGPVRVVTRVKGLAFGKSRYAATINRDYDQRLGISVRNHSDNPMTVKLDCGKLPEEELLLVGFVGEGSEGAPFALAPGEEREFMLGISAQDVVKAAHRFPIRIASVSGEGFADLAEVELNVKLPEVKLDWQAVGVAPSGLGQVFRLINNGDSLTDLRLWADNPDVLIRPSIGHGLFPAGQSLTVTVEPVLYDGFSAVTAIVAAGAVGKSVTQEVKIALPEGQRLFDIYVTPGMDPQSNESATEADEVVTETFDPESVDWNRRTSPEDIDGDGRVDRWTIRDTKRNVLWVGNDTDGDGEVDFVHADIGGKGRFDFSAYKTPQGWQRTNIIEAWLEMVFKLPCARNSYEKHDVDLVFNGTVIGRLRDVIPEGSYAFRIPPRVMRFSPDGQLEGNSVQVQSHHLRGGHYIVSSDFRIKLRLLDCQKWVAAESREQAFEKFAQMPGLSMTGADYSVSSAEAKLEWDGAPGKGVQAYFTVPMRNLGPASAERVAVALVLSGAGQGDVELSRVYVEKPPLSGSTMIRVPWIAAAGTHTLKVVVDPDNELGDKNRTNQEAWLTVQVPGETTMPTLELLEPADGAMLKETVATIRANAAHEIGVARVQVQVDAGLWQDLSATQDGYGGAMLLQPGSHQLKVQVLDTGGNVVQKVANVTVDVSVPEGELLEPANEQVFDSRKAAIHVKCAPETVLTAGRVNGGPWKRLALTDGLAEGVVPLTFGDVKIDVMIAGANGAYRILSRSVRCSVQPIEEGPQPVLDDLPGQADGTVLIDKLGEIDFFAPPNSILRQPRHDSGPLPATPDRNTIREVHIERHGDKQ